MPEGMVTGTYPIVVALPREAMGCVEATPYVGHDRRIAGFHRRLEAHDFRDFPSPHATLPFDEKNIHRTGLRVEGPPIVR